MNYGQFYFLIDSGIINKINNYKFSIKSDNLFMIESQKLYNNPTGYFNTAVTDPSLIETHVKSALARITAIKDTKDGVFVVYGGSNPTVRFTCYTDDATQTIEIVRVDAE